MTGDPHTDALAALAAVVDLGGRATPRQVTARLTRAARRDVEESVVVMALADCVTRGWLDVAFDADRGNAYVATGEGHRNAGSLHAIFRRRIRRAQVERAPRRAVAVPPLGKRPHRNAQVIDCGCGCGGQRWSMDRAGVRRDYISGHHPIPRPIADAVDRALRAGAETAQQVAAALGWTRYHASKRLTSLAERGLIERVSRGRYAALDDDAGEGAA